MMIFFMCAFATGPITDEHDEFLRRMNGPPDPRYYMEAIEPKISNIENFISDDQLQKPSER